MVGSPVLIDRIHVDVLIGLICAVVQRIRIPAEMVGQGELPFYRIIEAFPVKGKVKSNPHNITCE